MYGETTSPYYTLTPPGDATLPRLQYLDHKGETHAATFSTPKKVSELDQWLKSAKAALAIIPVTFHRNVATPFIGWGTDGQAQVSPTYIKFGFRSPEGAKATLVIDRTYKEYGR